MKSNITHVGEILKDELHARKMSQMELALRSRISQTIICEIIQGRRGINAKYAVAFENPLGIDAEYWLSAQSLYEIAIERERVKITKKKRK